MANFFEDLVDEKPAPRPASKQNFFADLVTDDSQPKDDDSQITRGFKAGVDQTQGLLYGAAGMAGEAVGSDKLRDWGLEGYQRNMAEADAHGGNVRSISEIDSLEDAADYVLYGLGNVTAQMIPSLVTGGAGALAGRQAVKTAAKRLLQSELKKGATKEQAVKAARQKIVEGQVKGGIVGGGATSVGLSTGEIGGEIHEQTGEVRPGTALTFGTIAGALDYLPVSRVLDRLGVGRKFRDEVSQSLLKDIGTQTALEAGTEGAQTVVEKAAVNWVDSNRGIFSPENLVEIADSMALGGMGGATIGTASGIARNALSYERKMDETADAAAREVKARGGDALDAENARTFVYNDLDVEFVRPDIADIQRQNNFDPATGQPITPPAVPEGIPFKPPQPPGLSMADMEQQPRQDQGIDFNIAPRKAEVIERAQQDYQQAKEDVSLESSALPQPESVPAEPADYLPALPALEEREQEAIGQLERQARNLEKAKPKPVPARGRQVEPDMELSTAVAVAGGINIDEARAQGLDPQSRRDRVGIRPIFTRKGQSLDGMAETLNQYGFRDADGNELTANSLLDELDRSLSGQEVYSTANTGLPAQRQAVDRDIEEIDRQIDAIRQHYTDDELDPPKAKALTDATDIERELDYTILEADLLMPQDRVNGIINAADSDQGALQALRKEIDNVRGRNTQPAGPEARTGSEAPSQGERASQEAGRPAGAREAPERGQFGPESERDGRLGPEVGGRYRVDGARDSGAVQGQNQTEEVTDVDQAAYEAATSPENALPEPSDAQKSAGNYRKGHLSLHGLDISIENPRGSKRSGTAPDGRKWERTLAHHYGYFKRSEGRDGDQVDLFLTQNAEDADRPVFVIDQVNPQTGRFDEHKTVVGAATEAEAREAYLANYEDGWKGLGAISAMSLDEFKTWLREGDTKKPISKSLSTKAKLTSLQEARESKKNQQALQDTVIVEQFETENGELVEVEQSADVVFRQIDKRLAVMDQLLGCLMN